MTLTVAIHHTAVAFRGSGLKKKTIMSRRKKRKQCGRCNRVLNQFDRLSCCAEHFEKRGVTGCLR